MSYPYFLPCPAEGCSRSGKCLQKGKYHERYGMALKNGLGRASSISRDMRSIGENECSLFCFQNKNIKDFKLGQQLTSQNQGEFFHTMCEAVEWLATGCCSAETLQVNSNQESSCMRNTLWCIELLCLAQEVQRDYLELGTLGLPFFKCRHLSGCCQIKRSDRGGTSCLAMAVHIFIWRWIWCRN